jgi:predicted transcriptional regulator
MSKETHPLITHLKGTGESLTSFAARVEMSRMQLYRIINGEGTTTDTLKKISAATESAVSMSALLGISEDAA